MSRKHSFEATAWNANPYVTATSNTPKTPPSKPQSQCDCAADSPSHKTLILDTSFSHVSTRFLAISNESDTSCFHPKPSPESSPNVSAIALHLRTVADGCGRSDNESRTRLYPLTPRVKREPFATHSGTRVTSQFGPQQQKETR